MNPGPSMSPPVFLATTAFEDFWDSNSRLVFIGEECLLYRRRSYWQSLDGVMLASPYEKDGANDDAYQYISKVHESLLAALGDRLNLLHNVQHDDRYWRIMLGPWLQLYLSVTYDHFLKIQAAIAQYPGFKTIGLENASFVTPTDTMNHVELIKGDAFNLQIYTRIMICLGLHFPSKPIGHSENGSSQKLGPSFLRVLFECLVNGVTNLCTDSRRTLHLQASYFKKQTLRRLVALNPGKIWPRSSALSRCPVFTPDSQKRKQLSGMQFDGADFTNCLSAMLPDDIPQCFVEGFHTLQKNAKKKYWRRPKAIFSSNSWYFDEHFKHWAATSAEKGSLLLGTQHGGCYGVLRYKLAEDHEKSILDYFYSWGWESNGSRASVIAMPSTSFVDQQKLGADNTKMGILWAATAEPRYILEYPHLPSNFAAYLERQLQFIRCVSPFLFDQLRFRPHYEDHDWGISQRIKDEFPSIKIESWTIPFETSLKECRLYVCDHLSTTYAQARAADKPTILIFSVKHTTTISDKAKCHFDALREVGILFNAPEAAAEAISCIYDNVEEWWNDPERRKAVNAFCVDFANSPDNARESWEIEINRVLAL